MSEKIIIERVENHCAPLQPETHSVGAHILGEGVKCSCSTFNFPGHKADELGNFNTAARDAFKDYLKDKDLTPKKQNLYSGKIVLIDTKQEDNRYTLGSAILYVRDGLVHELGLLDSSKDLRIEKKMTCSDLYKRVVDMYFAGDATFTGCCWFDKVMYVGTELHD